MDVIMDHNRLPILQVDIVVTYTDLTAYALTDDKCMSGQVADYGQLYHKVDDR